MFDAIEKEARAWYGTKYHHKGRVKGVGVDCGGFIYELFKPFLDLPPFPNYPEDWAMHHENEIFLTFLVPFVEEVDTPSHGTVTMFKFGRNYGHAAFMMKDGRYIHAWGGGYQGSVQIDQPIFFRKKSGSMRDCRHFNLRSEFWQKH